MNDNPVETIFEQYLDHLESGSPKPSLDGLAAEDRRRASELIAILEAGRGIDFRQSPPTADALLAGTEFDSWLNNPEPAADPDILDVVRTATVNAYGLAAAPRPDVEAARDHVRTQAVSVIGGIRLRFQFRGDLDSITLRGVDPQRAVGSVFGRFPDTVGVIIVIDDEDLTSVAVSPYDIDRYVSAPDGIFHEPAITRPCLPLADTLARYLDEVAPDLAAVQSLPARGHVDPAAIVDAEVSRVIADMVKAGTTARIPAKKTAFGGLVDRRDDLFSLVLDVATGDLSPADLDDRIDLLNRDAA